MHAGPTRQGRRTGTSEDLPGEVELARRVVAVLGGRYSAELGIDVDAGDAEVERWFVAATLFGARIPACVAERAFGVLATAGLARIGQLRHVPSADLIAMLTGARAGLTGLAGLAAASGLDVRDLESGLVRLELAHRRAMARCPGGQACTALQSPRPG